MVAMEWKNGNGTTERHISCYSASPTQAHTIYQHCECTRQVNVG